MIHEAFPARRPFQKVVHATLDVGAGEDRPDPGAVHWHPKRHPGVSWVRVGVCWGDLTVGGRACCHFASLVVRRRLRFGCAKADFRQLQIQRWFSMWGFCRAPLSRNWIAHCTFLLSYSRTLNLFSCSWMFARAHLLSAAHQGAQAHELLLIILRTTGFWFFNLTLRLSGLLLKRCALVLNEYPPACIRVLMSLEGCGRQAVRSSEPPAGEVFRTLTKVF